jgi:hypothetical protein
MILPLGVLFQSMSEKADVASSMPPELGPFIDIWSGDSVQNWGPEVAYNDLRDEYLIVWLNERASSLDIYARRVGGDGSVRSWFAIAADPGIEYYNPVVAFSPKQERYLIVYQKYINMNYSEIWGRFVSWDGSWMGNPFPIRQDPDHQRRPDITYNIQDDEFLVVYENAWASGLHDIAAQRIKASDGSLLSWRNIATGTSQARTHPSVAYNESRNEYLIAYLYQPVDIYQPSDIYGKVSSATMGVLSNELIISDKPVCEQKVSVGAGPDEYLVVWADRVCGTNDSNIYARRLKGDGSLTGPTGGFPILINPHYLSNPSLAFGQNHAYLVVWRHVPNNSTTIWDVYGNYVIPGQDKPADIEFEISNFPSWDSSVDVACEQSGNCLVVMNNLLVSGGDLEIQGRIVMSPRQIYIPIIVDGGQ